MPTETEYRLSRKRLEKCATCDDRHMPGDPQCYECKHEPPAADADNPAKRAALRIWTMVNEQGQDALSTNFYEKVIEREYAALVAQRDTLQEALRLALTTPGMIRGRDQAEAALALTETASKD